MSFTGRAQTILSELTPVLESVKEEDFAAVVEALAASGRIFVAGAGRSGLIGRMLAMRLAQAGFAAHMVGESTTPAIAAGDLLFICSGSGHTATLQPVAEKASALGAKLVLLTYRLGSPLALQADLILSLPVPLDPSRPGGLAGDQLLGTRFDQCALLTVDALVAEVCARLDIPPSTLAGRHANLE